MFLRAKVRKKDGKQHRYFIVVENRRVGQSKTAQRTVLYLGEINDRQEATWRKTLQVFDENHQQYTTLSLFPEDREIPAESSNSIQVKLSAMELRRPRAFGNCWLGCELWRQLRLGEFWEEKLSEKAASPIHNSKFSSASTCSNQRACFRPLIQKGYRARTVHL